MDFLFFFFLFFFFVFVLHADNFKVLVMHSCGHCFNNITYPLVLVINSLILVYRRQNPLSRFLIYILSPALQRFFIYSHRRYTLSFLKESKLFLARWWFLLVKRGLQNTLPNESLHAMYTDVPT
jgi:hypothetical protein